MVKKKMYQKINKLKKRGKSKTEIASDLSLDPATVRKYYQMVPDAYIHYQEQLTERKKLFESFIDEIKEIYELNDSRNLNMAAVYDYLEEKYSILPGNEQTLRNYIHYLIQNGDIMLSNKIRCYEKVEQLPYGKQLQIDFGEYKTKSKLKLYIFAAVLSASRYKYLALQATPFTTMDLIHHLLDCFDYMGGIPEELVIDQDSIMVVAENEGDIIYTRKFDQFIEEMSLNMYVCRKSDPESKGKVENVIKYVKYNFLQIRDFNTLETAQEALEKWLKRRANGKISQATKKIPLNEIEIERKHLSPLRNTIFRKNMLLNREVRLVSDKGFIMVDTNEYSMPMKYRNRQVEIYKTETELYVYDQHTGQEIACHTLSLLSGKRITNRDHFRRKSFPIKDLHQKTRILHRFSSWKTFVDLNIKTYQRFSRDQCMIAIAHFAHVEDSGVFEMAVDYCLENNTLSMNNLKDTYQHKLQEHDEDQAFIHSLFTRVLKRPHPAGPAVARRSIDEYEKTISGAAQ